MGYNGQKSSLLHVASHPAALYFSAINSCHLSNTLSSSIPRLMTLLLSSQDRKDQVSAGRHLPLSPSHLLSFQQTDQRSPERAHFALPFPFVALIRHRLIIRSFFCVCFFVQAPSTAYYFLFCHRGFQLYKKALS